MCDTRERALPYYDYGRWIGQFFTCKVQKLSVDAGFSCPNRDGRLSVGGCSYCDNRTFLAPYCDRSKSICEQLREGKKFFSAKYPHMKYIAYFQSYSNTYASLKVLKCRYEEALGETDVVGIVISTRPDCVDEVTLAYLSSLAKQTFVMIEYGVESVYDTVLANVNRGHTFETSRNAIIATHASGIFCGAHVIVGLPGESADMTLHSAQTLSSLPLDVLKIHHLQLIRGTRLASHVPLPPVYDLADYISLLADYIEHLRPDLCLERFVSQSPDDLLLAPRWGLKNHEFTHKLVSYMLERGMYQGRLYV